MDGPTIALVRSLLCVIFSYMVISRLKLEIWPSTDDDRQTHLVRMMIGAVGTVCLHSALGLIPLQITMVIISLNTPINVLILLCLGKCASPPVWLCVLTTFFGVVLVVDPSLLGFSTESYAFSRIYSSGELSFLGLILALTAATFFALNRIYLSGKSRVL
jgi:drug/metabolite transporter (DMT)-like permease